MKAGARRIGIEQVGRFGERTIEGPQCEVIGDAHGGQCCVLKRFLGSVWLLNLKAGTVWRIDRKRIEATVMP